MILEDNRPEKLPLLRALAYAGFKIDNLIKSDTKSTPNQVLALLREEVNRTYGVNLTDHRIVSEFATDEIPSDLMTLLGDLDAYRTSK